MKSKQLFQGLFASAGMLLLILDGKTALEGAYSGIDLCIKTVIPSLFPFFVLSLLFTSAFSSCSFPILSSLGKLCAIPRGTESILVTGFLGGYPVGAQCIAANWKSGLLSKTDAERMLRFCNNPGPAFLFGMAASMFPSPWYSWLLWAVVICSAVLVSMCFPERSVPMANLPKNAPLSVTSALHSSIQAMASVCGWVVLFRVIIAFLDHWFFWLLPDTASVFLTGLLEISNGCCMLSAVENVRIRFLICSTILSFGGICVTMQTLSVLSGLSARKYIEGKLLQTAFSLLLSIGILFNSWLLCLFLAIPLLRKKQKSSSFQKSFGV